MINGGAEIQCGAEMEFRTHNFNPQVNMLQKLLIQPEVREGFAEEGTLELKVSISLSKDSTELICGNGVVRCRVGKVGKGEEAPVLGG